MAFIGHISEINAGVTSFKQLQLDSSITKVNVHSNSIESFHGLESAPQLEKLDASSNEIKSLSGIGSFTRLTVLNLASNHISDLQGLGSLTNLTYLNVSYNCISDLTGLRELNGPTYKIEAIELHGNRINDIQEVFANISGVLSLSYLVLSQNAQHGNPVCKLPNYRAKIFQHIPQLISLDNKDRSGQPASYTQQDFDEGLNLDFTLTDIEQLSSDVMSSINKSPQNIRKLISTPHIDAVLSSNRRTSTNPVQSQVQTIDSFVESFISSMGEEESKTKQNVESSPKDQEERLKLLEMQLANLVAARKETESSEKKYKDKQEKSVNQSSSSSVYVPKPRAPVSHTTNNGKGNKVLAHQRKNHKPNAIEKETYMNLVKELETERERRWKAEQAARKLAELVRKLSHDKAEGKSLQDMAAEAAEKLKQTVIREKDKSEGIKTKLLQCEEKLVELSDEVVEYKRIVSEQNDAIAKAEFMSSETAANNAKVISEHVKRLHDSEIRASAALREVDMQKVRNSQLEKQITELQELLLTTKQQHEKDKENLFSSNSPEFKNALSREVNKQEKCHREEIKMLQSMITGLKQQYADLEDEFRQGLHIEANRFAQISSENVSLIKEIEKLRALYARSKEKEEKCQSIISELTSVAKEQKLKILELVNSKKEMAQQFDDRLSKLEVAAENGRKNGIQLELVKQEKSRLISQLTAVQTVVEGLRDERKLWGHELAQQGASLAQDRGRLESKIESLQQEIVTLKKENERDLDSVRIKSKVIEDQTETIHKMKQGLMEKDQQIKKIQEESLDRQNTLEHEVEELTRDNSALNEEITALTERKKELKEHIADSEREFEDLKRVHSGLVKKWSEKGRILSQLENQVKQMKESYDRKVQNTIKERDDALESKILLTDRLAKSDTAFREQLEAANAAHQEQMNLVMKNCNNEVEAMKRKVSSVEEEMREVLRDAERQKKAMEMKFNKVTSVFKEMQDGFKL